MSADSNTMICMHAVGIQTSCIVLVGTTFSTLYTYLYATFSSIITRISILLIILLVFLRRNTSHTQPNKLLACFLSSIWPAARYAAGSLAQVANKIIIIIIIIIIIMTFVRLYGVLRS